MANSGYPMSDKLLAVQAKSALLSEFLDWLGEQNIALCTLQELEYADGGFTKPRWQPLNKSFEQLLADFFEIDLKQLEDERRDILDKIREAQTC